MFFTILLGFILFLLLLHCFLRYSRMGRIFSKIPGPTSFPIVGNLFDFQVPTEDLLLKLWEVNRQYYPFYKLWFLRYCGIILLHPDDIEVLMRSSKYIEKGLVYHFLKPWLSNGLLTSSAEKWQIRRKILTPAFHFNILKHFVVTFNNEARYLVTSLKEEGKGAAVVKDLQEFINQHTLNIICETAMGTSLKGKGELESTYRNAVRTLSKTVAYRFVRPWYYPDIIFSLSSVGRLQKKQLKILHGFSKKIIAERIRFHEETNGKYLHNFEGIDEDDGSCEGTEDRNKNSMFKNRLALLDLLIASSLNGNQIDEEGIREEVDTFMFEGHDTTASALYFILSLFAKHKDVQERIRDEVKPVMQENYNLTISMLQEFPYLERCLKESLRLYPSVHLIFRHLMQDLQLKNYLLPAGSICHINIYSIHRNPKYWPNPEVFDPDRFLPEKIKDRHPYSYIPFSAGPRNCIGQRFAMLEIKVIAAYILYNFYLEPVDDLDDVKMNADFTLHSVNPLRVKFIPIK
ncbi:cytochrome P450 4C1-like isoform X1 [Vespula pensylvanica]|uniref:cytochrome P450 4C1-like isoform X1 n=1 Tax=Vespula pensylvanica TaxID=30213 RepID=UPI001CBA032C|nr:cytochrome P450 4C1-like isoform X1 [Vespula pensylvanica]